MADKEGFRGVSERHLPFTEQHLTSALATCFSKKKKKKIKEKGKRFFPLKRQSIYIRSQIAQAGMMECSENRW